MKQSPLLMDYPTLRKESGGSSKFKRLRASFACSRNPDVEHFIHAEYSKYERDFNTRNYFFLDVENSRIAAFFTLSLHSIILGELLSNIDESTMSVLRGYGKRDARSVGCYLIGQLARDESYSHADISGDDILREVMTRLVYTRDIVGGRFVAIDCEEPLVPFYQDRGFALVNSHADLFSMIMPITNLN